MKAPVLLFVLLSGISVSALIATTRRHSPPPSNSSETAPASVPVAAPARPQTTADRIASGAAAIVASKPRYYETYETIKYPSGDVPATYGVCTDLVIRSFRSADIDLQKLLHEDRVKNPGAYPRELWEYKKPDANIDHRRCQNLGVFLSRRAKSLTTSVNSDKLAQWQSGDVVFFVKEKSKHPWHVAIISDKTGSDGMPLINHLFPPHAMTDRLDEFGPIHSHFRWQ